MRAREGWTDERLDQWIGNLLRAGVIVAALVALGGGVLYMVKYGAQVGHYHVFRGEPTDLRSVNGILSDALSLRSRGLSQLGLLLLIATPIARVVLSAIVFFLERDYRYVLITVIVLAVLVFSLLGGQI